MQLQKNLAISLGQIRAQKNKSVSDFSDQLGIARSSLQLLLQGRGNPRLDTVEYIAERLLVNPEVLLCGRNAQEQVQALEYLLRTINPVGGLPEERHRQLAILLWELLSLWDLASSRG